MKDRVYILNIKNMHIEYKTLLNELPMYCLHKIDNGCNEKLKKERTIAWYMLYKLLLVYHNIDLTNVVYMKIKMVNLILMIFSLI